jgi:hypothetical protein
VTASSTYPCTSDVNNTWRTNQTHRLERRVRCSTQAKSKTERAAPAHLCTHPTQPCRPACAQQTKGPAYQLRTICTKVLVATWDACTFGDAVLEDSWQGRKCSAVVRVLQVYAGLDASAASWELRWAGGPDIAQVGRVWVRLQGVTSWYGGICGLQMVMNICLYIRFGIFVVKWPEK